ncbi:MAG TPA: hypothetical protein VD866_14620 [Urbifossiella sp.]|nr:hypothetical protein [Urbifossiella sp.]
MLRFTSLSRKRLAVAHPTSSSLAVSVTLIQEQETLGIVPVFWKDEEECRTAIGQAAAMGIEPQR